MSFTSTQQSLFQALNYKTPDCKHEGSLATVHKFGHKWFNTREKFLTTAFAASVDLVHCLASALFHTMWSLTVGKGFTEQGPRDLALRCWEKTGINAEVLLKSLVGVLCPTFARMIAKQTFSTETVPNSKETSIQVPSSNVEEITAEESENEENPILSTENSVTFVPDQDKT